MFRNLRVKEERGKLAPDPVDLSLEGLTGEPGWPISIRSLNKLHDNLKRRIYRALIPHGLFSRFDIDPITWLGPDKQPYVDLRADLAATVEISARSPYDTTDPFVSVELSDNRLNGVDLGLIVLSDPDSPRFGIDRDDEGNATMYGTKGRNLAQEEEAMRAGLAPGQIRSGLSASREILEQIETFLMILGHRAFYLEPLTYASAWHFERRGFAYVQGHQLMDQIHMEFQPGGRLQQALDGSSPFRQPEQANTVRGRAWAIHDGILEALDLRWDGLRMVKQLGRQAGVTTFPDAAY